MTFISTLKLGWKRVIFVLWVWGMNPYHLENYDYSLPQERIATHPVTPRDAARLLIWPPIQHKHFYDLVDELNAGDVVVVNNSKVIPARLRGIRPSRNATSPSVDVELLLLRPQGDFTTWRAFAKPARRLKENDVIHFQKNVRATVIERLGAEVIVQFNLGSNEVEAFLDEQGDVPLPPYIDRATDQSDKTEYQTVYVDNNAAGSVAAPTAGLHFTDALLDKLRNKGVAIVEVTLHVGAGTFLPVTVDDVRMHKMHREWGVITEQAATQIKSARSKGHKVIAVGTTATRLLETAAQQPNSFGAWQGETDIFITPGFEFKIVDRLITNFHLPKSTLLMLVSAFMGSIDAMQALYADAIAENYRFYSYGDACLLTRPTARVS